MDRCPKDGEWHSRADEVHRPAVRKLPLEWKPRWKATKEMHSFPVDSTIGGAHKRREIRSAISARLSMFCFLGSGSRLEHRTDRPTNVRSRIGVYNFEIDQHLTLRVPDASHAKVADQATFVSAPLRPNHRLRCHVAKAHRGQLPSNITYLIVSTNHVAAVGAVEAMVQWEPFPTAIAGAGKAQKGLVEAHGQSIPELLRRQNGVVLFAGHGGQPSTSRKVLGSSGTTLREAT